MAAETISQVTPITPRRPYAFQVECPFRIRFGNEICPSVLEAVVRSPNARKRTADLETQSVAVAVEQLGVDVHLTSPAITGAGAVASGIRTFRITRCKGKK